MKEALLKELGNPTRLHFINTRLILTIDVNLNATDATDTDPAKIDQAVSALQKMGFLKNVEGARGT
ncbi:MAG: hypothetical protein JNL21_17485 [Myxococcales bacterium]|nr:hypothetical protein [Myxococcales bacterium]